ncbi:hypothetical protein F0L74_09765 [Chitinophaga agrisoli]|uniref:Uncharacterized protein n=1 Tax=Chitinophaga agrisoli TaxID=2607653 RepID=A0A5B2VUQ4_9BACT|nr:hypothetical protein [Chitinophaga agrisoli]KAA2242805.1 hypothetical protein F0L74_09765 [Chitinophaga agrisoli]
MATTARFTNNVGVINQGKDNTDRIRTNEYLTPDFAATIAIAPTKSYTLVKPGTLTGAVTFTAGVGTSTTAPYVGDTMTFILIPDGTTRVATFGTGFLPTGTLSVTTAKTANISFIFDGANWEETGRSVSA